MARTPLNPLKEKPDKPELRRDQIEDLAKFVMQPRHAVLSDPGTGKTPSVCAYFEFMWVYYDLKSVWIMPKSLMRKNRDEILRFTNLRPEHVQIMDGPPDKREAKIKDDDAVVWLMPFNRWRTDWKKFLQAQPKIGVVSGDEVHMGWKTHDSATTVELFKSMKNLPRFLPMTGTLIAGRLDNAYPVIHLIEPRYYPNHKVFFNQHAITDIDGNVTGWRNHEKLGRILAHHATRRRFEDIFGEQQIVEQPVICSMTPSQREAYESMEDEAVLELENEIIDGSLPGVNTIRCRQIMEHPETMGLLKKGEVTGKDAQFQIDMADARQTGEPLLVYSVLKPEQERLLDLARKAGFKADLINGDVSGSARDRIDNAFQRGDIKVLVCSPQTAAFGYNWSHVDHTIFVSRDYQDDSYSQAYKRAIRGTRKKPLRISIYEYENSIDQRIGGIVKRKAKDSKRVDESVAA